MTTEQPILSCYELIAVHVTDAGHPIGLQARTMPVDGHTPESPKVATIFTVYCTFLLDNDLPRWIVAHWVFRDGQYSHGKEHHCKIDQHIVSPMLSRETLYEMVWRGENNVLHAHQATPIPSVSPHETLQYDGPAQLMLTIRADKPNHLGAWVPFSVYVIDTKAQGTVHRFAFRRGMTAIFRPEVVAA